jgi:hypothetical protein
MCPSFATKALLYFHESKEQMDDCSYQLRYARFGFPRVKGQLTLLGE